MAMSRRRNALLPWYIGLVIIAVVDAYVAYTFHAIKCEATGLPEFLVLVVMPAVYLVLMYLTLRSQP